MDGGRLRRRVQAGDVRRRHTAQRLRHVHRHAAASSSRSTTLRSLRLRRHSVPVASPFDNAQVSFFNSTRISRTARSTASRYSSTKTSAALPTSSRSASQRAIRTSTTLPFARCSSPATRRCRRFLAPLRTSVPRRRQQPPRFADVQLDDLDDVPAPAAAARPRDASRLRRQVDGAADLAAGVPQVSRARHRLVLDGGQPPLRAATSRATT